MHRLRAGGRRAERAVPARQLDQRGGSRGVVVRAGPRPDVVPVREDEDRVGRRAGDHGRRDCAGARGRGQGSSRPTRPRPRRGRTARASPSPSRPRPSLPREPGSRSGKSVASSAARPVAALPSNDGGKAEAGYGPGRPIVSMSRRSGASTRSAVPRTSEPLTGGSSEPRRAPRRARAGRSARIDRQVVRRGPLRAPAAPPA